jgi:ATP-dependent RNA helicase DeaD
VGRSPRRLAADRDAAPRERCSRGEPDEGLTRLFIGAGREAGVGPGDLVGAIAGEAGISSREIGAISIAERFALVEVPERLADKVIEALRGTTIRGRKTTVRRERER